MLIGSERDNINEQVGLSFVDFGSGHSSVVINWLLSIDEILSMTKSGVLPAHESLICGHR